MRRLSLSPIVDPFFTCTSPWEWSEDLEAFFRAPFSMIREPLLTTGDWCPGVDLLETDEAYVVRVDLPGVTDDSVELSLDGEVLTVAGTREVSEQEGTYIRRELPSGSFRHQVRLPGEVNADAVKAVHAQGVLTVTLPKLEAKAPRRIDVQPL